MVAHSHLPIASQYDVPTISLQYPVVNKIIKNPEEGPKSWFTSEGSEPTGVDLRHVRGQRLCPDGGGSSVARGERALITLYLGISQLGRMAHEVTASLTTIYLDRLQCQIDAGYYDYEKEEVPSNRLLLPSIEEVDDIPRVRPCFLRFLGTHGAGTLMCQYVRTNFTAHGIRCMGRRQGRPSRPSNVLLDQLGKA
jgi:hypothetical protein